MKAISGTIPVRPQANAPSGEPEKCLLISGIVIRSSARPTVGVGDRLSRKSQLIQTAKESREKAETSQCIGSFTNREEAY